MKKLSIHPSIIDLGGGGGWMRDTPHDETSCDIFKCPVKVSLYCSTTATGNY